MPNSASALHHPPDDCGPPSLFYIYILTSSGAIQCWECIEKGTEVTPNIHSNLLGTAFGHKNSISNIYVNGGHAHISSPSSSLIATMESNSNKTIIWKLKEPKLFHPHFVLNTEEDILGTAVTTATSTTASSSENNTKFAWTPSGMCLCFSSLSHFLFCPFLLLLLDLLTLLSILQACLC